MRAFLLVLACFAMPVRALAHPILDQAAAHLDAVEFELARQALEQAEEAHDLTRDDVVRWLVLHALLAHAQQTDDLPRVLTQLAALAPEAELGPTAPPTLRAQLTQRVSEGNRLSMSAAMSDDATILTVVQHDYGLVRSIRVRWRTVGGAWSESRSTTVNVPSSRVEFYAEALGPGDAILDSTGSESAPIRPALEPGQVAIQAPETATASATATATQDSNPRGPGLAIGLSITAVAVVVATVLAIVLTRPTDTNVGSPQVEWDP